MKPSASKAFWSIIALLDWKKSKDDDILHPAIQTLSTYSIANIKAFEDQLSWHLHQLDGEAWAKRTGRYAYKDEDHHFSVDLFLYARCYVVARGKKFYDTVRRSPQRMPKNQDFEALLEVAQSAYELKTKKTWAYVSKWDYETFANGQGWQS